MGPTMAGQNKDDFTLVGQTAPAVPVATEAAGREGTPAYRCIEQLLTTQYRIAGADAIRAEQPNATRLTNMACCFFRPCGVHTFDVPRGCVRLAEDGSGNYEIYGPGVHRVNNLFMSVWDDVALTQEVIVHGDRTIVTVKQGSVGYCEDMGQPILLPPGLHEWQSQTLKFKESVDLNNSLIRLGPYTIITVDEGYCAVTQVPNPDPDRNPNPNPNPKPVAPPTIPPTTAPPTTVTPPPTTATPPL